jgi:ribonuclease HI
MAGDLEKHVIIHTDGACVGNPGPGGWAYILQWGKHRKTQSGGFRLTTNNRMEMTAAVQALRALKQSCKVEIRSDAFILCSPMNNGHAVLWRKWGWRRKPNSPKFVPNWDLWEQLLLACEKHTVTFVQIKGHAGIAENEECDVFAVKAAESNPTEIDPGYEDKSIVPANSTLPGLSLSTPVPQELGIAHSKTPPN